MLFSCLIGQFLKETDSESSPLERTKGLLQSKGHDGFTPVDEAFTRIWNYLDRMFNLEFNPTSSVIGSVISQEIIKVITQRDSPAHGFMIYNSDDQSFVIEK